MTATRPLVPGTTTDPATAPDAIPTLDEIPDLLTPEAARVAPSGELATRTVAGWRSIMNRSYGELDFASLDKNRFAAGLRSSSLRDLSMYSIRATELIAARTPQQAARSTDEVTVMIWQTSGRSVATQGARRTTVDAGDVVFMDFTEPYTVECVTPYTQLVMMVPTEQLRRRTPAGHPVALHAVKLHDPALASPWLALLRELCRQSITGAGPTVPAFYSSAIDAIGNLATQAHQPASVSAPAAGSGELTRRRVFDFIDDHCDDPELNADAIARGVSISRRTLFRVFRDAELRLEDYLLGARLERALDLLEAPGNDLTVDAVAHQSGFRSTSHFHARFLERYGRTPARYRSGHAAA